MIFIFGSARSGSTWLAKLFDSHPDLLYLHEPDIVDRGMDLLPHWFRREPTPAEIGNAQKYLTRLSLRRSPRTVGIRPFFSKSYRGPVPEASRRALIYGNKLLERAGLSALSDRLEIPDLVTDGASPRVVIKSVSALGRAEVLLAADRTIAPILLIRHPCGYVNSMLRGEALGVMTKAAALGRLVMTRSASQLGLNPAALADADEVTLLAWTWLISNAEALPAIQRANGIILIYEEVAREPETQLRQLFGCLALGWPAQTAAFIAHSQSSDGDYYSVFRDSKEASQRWRSELNETTIAKIRSIVSRDPIGAQFFMR